MGQFVWLLSGVCAAVRKSARPGFPTTALFIILCMYSCTFPAQINYIRNVLPFQAIAIDEKASLAMDDGNETNVWHMALPVAERGSSKCSSNGGINDGLSLSWYRLSKAFNWSSLGILIARVCEPFAHILITRTYFNVFLPAVISDVSTLVIHQHSMYTTLRLFKPKLTIRIFVSY